MLPLVERENRGDFPFTNRNWTLGRINIRPAFLVTALRQIHPIGEGKRKPLAGQRRWGHRRPRAVELRSERRVCFRRTEDGLPVSDRNTFAPQVQSKRMQGDTTGAPKADRIERLNPDAQNAESPPVRGRVESAAKAVDL